MNRKNGKGRHRPDTSRAAGGRTVMWICMLVVCALAVIAGLNIMALKIIRSYDPETVISGVKIGMTDVSHMTADEAKEAVLHDIEKYAQKELVLQIDENRKAEVLLSELGISAENLDSAVQDAADYGKKGNPLTCYKILKNAEKNENEKVFDLKYQAGEKETESVLNEKISGLLNSPVNASLTLDGEKTVIIEDEPGEEVDFDATVENINRCIMEDDMESPAEAAVVTERKNADIRTEDLEEITDVLGTFTTDYSGGDAGRTLNVETGASHIGGTLTEPGEEISADALMAPYTEENGYAMAASYENNEVVESMGGGICQVSTTLYNALLRAEIEITERNAHSMLVSYVEPSMDAAIAGDVKDLKFRNNLENPIYIEAVLSGGTVTFRIYGKETRDLNRTVEYVSETLETTESDETRFVATEDPVGTTYTQDSGHKGLTACLWKIVYENGEEISKEQINYSSYLASGKTVAVGTFTEDEELSQKLISAIEAQDEEMILTLTDVHEDNSPEKNDE